DVGVPGDGHGDAARPHQRQARHCGSKRVLWFIAAFPVHGPDEPVVGNYAQTPSFGARTGWSFQRASGIRSTRRASHALWPDLSDRDPGRSEYRIDLIAELLRANQ